MQDVMGLFYNMLARDPGLQGWLGWYWVLIDDAGTRTLIGNGGFTGRPVNGVVAIGYSVLRQYQGRGYATEAVEGLVSWAFGHPEIASVIAEAASSNEPSLAVLRKNRFVCTGPGSEEGLLRFERRRARS